MHTPNPMIVTQELVNAIIKRAEQSRYGLEKSEKNLNISMYKPQDLNSLGLMLVSGWHDKYDLVSVFVAALQEVEERMTKVD